MPYSRLINLGLLVLMFLNGRPISDEKTEGIKNMLNVTLKFQAVAERKVRTIWFFVMYLVVSPCPLVR